MKHQTNRSNAKFHRVSSPIDPIFLNPPYGIFSAIARRLGKSPSHVRKVALGQHTSKLVAKALLAEANRVRKAWMRTSKGERAA